jgi:hypothetical protein
MNTCLNARLVMWLVVAGLLASSCSGSGTEHDETVGAIGAAGCSVVPIRDVQIGNLGSSSAFACERKSR